jgi:hypothetical protein
MNLNQAELELRGRHPALGPVTMSQLLASWPAHDVQMRGHGAKFGRKKEEAIAALLSSKSIEDAARAVGINPNTLLRWLAIPEFRDAYLKVRREGVGQSVARLQQATGAAAVTILKLMADPSSPPAVRLRAAESVFYHAIKGIELEDIEARVAALEDAAAANETPRR